MNTYQALQSRRRRAGWALGAVGILSCATGVALQATRPALTFDPRLVTGLGILLIGLGVASLLRGGLAESSSEASRRLGVEELDERNVAIRRLAGSRAFIASAALTYLLLMWVSFASNGQLPTLSADALWYALAAAFVVPVIVYLASMIHSQHSM